MTSVRFCHFREFNFQVLFVKRAHTPNSGIWELPEQTQPMNIKNPPHGLSLSFIIALFLVPLIDMLQRTVCKWENPLKQRAVRGTGGVLLLVTSFLSNHNNNENITIHHAAAFLLKKNL
jgi:hypothetical protein